jgi:hypothetical protein
MLPFGGLHVKHAVQREIWIPIQHLLWEQGKPWSSWPVARPSRCKLTSSQKSGIKYGSPKISPYLWATSVHDSGSGSAYFATDGQSDSLSWSRAPLSDICGLHAEGCPPWWEDGSVIYSHNLLWPIMVMFGSMPLGYSQALYLLTCYHQYDQSDHVEFQAFSVACRVV